MLAFEVPGLVCGTLDSYLNGIVAVLAVYGSYGSGQSLLLLTGNSVEQVGLDGRVRNYVPDNDTGFLVLVTALFAKISSECPDCGAHKFLKVVGWYLQVDGAVDTVLR